MVDQLFAHAGAGRIGDDNVRPALLVKKAVLAECGDVAGKEPGMADTVEGGVLPGVFHGFIDDLYADDPGGLAADENADAAGPAIQIIDGLFPGERREIRG